MRRILAACLLFVASRPTDAAAPPVPVDYLRHIKPLLRERCTACHGSLAQKSGLRLDTIALLRKGSDNGPVVNLADLDDSLLLERITSKVAARRMPPQGEPLHPEQIDALRTWIRAGMPGPTDEKPEPNPLDHWAFRKPVRPAVPAGAAPNPIDRFLQAKWREKQLQPAPSADRTTLIRRVYLDLIGLPPTRQQMREALADTAPGAHERLVDQLLASPRYGERWGRHWMDVWRYSDWYGRRSVPDVLNSYGQIWRWRDWIVRSLNEDRPYDRMVQEMLAADELAPLERENHVATGFLVRNFFRWNYNNWMRDNIEHTGKAFLGLTMQCAQCHDHKYDPITQTDYFRFRAFFEPLEIRHERMPGEPDPGVYPKYSYGAAYKPISSGMVRVMDEKLNAETYMYSRGDERDRVPGKPPVKPAAPAAFGGDRLVVAPVELPPENFYPALLPFVQEEEEAKRRADVETKRGLLTTARQQREVIEKQISDGDALGKLQAKLRQVRAAEAVRAADLAAAEAEWLALRARVAADRARHGKVPGSKGDAEAKLAARAEKTAAWLALRAKLEQQEQNLQAATLDGPATEIAKLGKQVADLRKSADAARAAIATAGDRYTPLGPVYPAKSTGRRLALARWITSPENPLTARVAVNHLWNWHFGRPLVESTANFGRNGSAPTHPELLDWLACELVDNGWRFKALHRRIVTSEAYRLASTHPADATNRQRDPDNHYQWRFLPRRLEAEVVRDSLLHCAGTLDETIGGPEIAQEKGLDVPRRSLYFAHHAEKRMDFLDLFDAANPVDCYRRTASVRPQQALALANNELTLRMARQLATRLASETDPTAFARAAFEEILAREATPEELAVATRFLDRQIELFRKVPPVPVAGAVGVQAPSLDPVRRARENLLAALFNHTEFVTLR
ncbi:MAG: PSD1 and planctomycete cytochrome C domain-containing protein [Gemmataceae bacterium]